MAVAADLKTFLRVEEMDEDLATMLLDAVSSEICTFADQTFTHAEETKIVNGSGTPLLILPGLPVSEVSEVKEDGEVVDPETYDWSESGMLFRRYGIWRARFRGYEVTYTHGVDGVPEHIKLLTIRVAARGYVNPTGLVQENEGGYGAGYGFDSSRMPKLTDEDRDLLRDFMGR